MVIDKYNARAKKIDSLLCVGLDSDFEKIPERFKNLEFPQFEFNKWIIEETHEYAAAFKMNSAFYEARGEQGLRELQMTTDHLRQNYPDVFLIDDAKRADIGNTNNGYIAAVFDRLGFDAITLHPYLGEEALAPFLDRSDKAAIVLCRTSNLGASELQDLEVEGKPLWQIVAERVSEVWNRNGNCMLVVGATYPEEMRKIREITGNMTFLVPGIGVQGGDLEAVLEAGLAPDGLGLIINSSRGIIFTEDPKAEAKNLCESIRNHKSKNGQ